MAPVPIPSQYTRVNYRLEDGSTDGIAILHPRRHFLMGGSVGGLRVNVGPGTDSRLPSLKRVFHRLPGLERQTNYFRSGAFVQLDFRDNPNGPKSGGNYVLQYSWYDDYKLGLYGFRRTDIDLQQLHSFFEQDAPLRTAGQSCLLRIRQRSDYSVLSTAGISAAPMTLRGFRHFALATTTRWFTTPSTSGRFSQGLEGALFFDAGKVMPRRGLLAFSGSGDQRGLRPAFQCPQRHVHSSRCWLQPRRFPGVV